MCGVLWAKAPLQSCRKPWVHALGEGTSGTAEEEQKLFATGRLPDTESNAAAEIQIMTNIIMIIVVSTTVMIRWVSACSTL